MTDGESKTRATRRPVLKRGPRPSAPSASSETAGTVLGVTEWFAPDEQGRVEESIRILAALGVQHIRVRLAWADWCTGPGRAWHEWLIRTLSRTLTVLPALTYVPPASGGLADATGPGANPKAFADFLDGFLQGFDHAFEWVELPSEPGRAGLWDWRLDPRGRIYSDIIGSAAYRCRQRGVKTVLGGLRPTDSVWFGLLCENGVIDFIDAIGLCVVSGVPDGGVGPWPKAVDRIRHDLKEYRQTARIWMTEAGCSMPDCDEFVQLQAFVDLLDAGVERVYWRSLRDPDATVAQNDGPYAPEPSHRPGLLRRDGTPRLLGRLWQAQGLERVRQFGRYGSAGNRHPVRREIRTRATSPDGPAGRPALITGGAGFIGSNLADRLLHLGRPVIILDNLARPGVEQNLEYLCETYGDLVEVHVNDVRDRRVVDGLVARCGSIFHLAAQAAVTTSLVDPISDFEANLQGTVNVLEAARRQDPPPPLLFTSTSKVYGDLHDIELVPAEHQHVPRDHQTRHYGISESRPLDFHSPHGCSKGAADQYVLDYARTYMMPNVVFRMSCIYGRRQLGTEDQGWVAHFARRMLSGDSLTVYGDGRQVRDILYIDDLLDAMLLAMDSIGRVAGRAFNMGGGPDRAVSLRQVVKLLSGLSGTEPQISHGPRRQGDRAYYVSDTRRFIAATRWLPRTSVERGVTQLYYWFRESTLAGVSRRNVREDS